MKPASPFEAFLAYVAAVVAASLILLVGWRAARDYIHMARALYYVVMS